MDSQRGAFPLISHPSDTIGSHDFTLAADLVFFLLHTSGFAILTQRQSHLIVWHKKQNYIREFYQIHIYNWTYSWTHSVKISECLKKSLILKQRLKLAKSAIHVDRLYHSTNTLKQCSYTLFIQLHVAPSRGVLELRYKPSNFLVLANTYFFPNLTKISSNRGT